MTLDDWLLIYTFSSLFSYVDRIAGQGYFHLVPPCVKCPFSISKWKIQNVK